VALKFGLFVPQGWKMDLAEIDDPVAQFEAMTAVAKAADAEPNWHSIWLYDHFHTVPTPEIETTFECWTTTATLARDTTRVRLGQMTGCNGFRNPALYAKIASTVDVASHGRLDAGLGAGWYKHEWEAYGYEFPETPKRMQRFKEAVQIVHTMWTEEKPVFKGKHYQIDGPINEPKGAQKPHIPFWIAGGGEKVTLKLVAQYGDACNIGREPDGIRHKLDVLKRHCDTLGRNYDEIIKSAEADIVLIDEGTNPDEVRNRGDFPTFGWPTLIGTPDQVRAHLHGLIDAGIDYVIVYFPRIAYNHEPLHRFAQEIAPEFV
jgi:F420-dependent oxidoreductase-like protein